MNTYWVNPEQSKPEVVVPPQTYGTPLYFLASATTLSPVVDDTVFSETYCELTYPYPEPYLILYHPFVLVSTIATFAPLFNFPIIFELVLAFCLTFKTLAVTVPVLLVAACATTVVDDGSISTTCPPTNNVVKTLNLWLSFSFSSPLVTILLYYNILPRYL